MKYLEIRRIEKKKNPTGIAGGIIEINGRLDKEKKLKRLKGLTWLRKKL